MWDFSGKTITRWQRVEHPAWSSQTIEICWQTLKSMSWIIQLALQGSVFLNQLTQRNWDEPVGCHHHGNLDVLLEKSPLSHLDRTIQSLITNITMNLAKSQYMVPVVMKYTSLYKTIFRQLLLLSPLYSENMCCAWEKIMFAPFGTYHVTTGVKVMLQVTPAPPQDSYNQSFTSSFSNYL